MSKPASDIFKFINLRGPSEGLSIDPSDDVDSAVVRSLSEVRVDPLRVSPEVVRHLGNRSVLTLDELSQSALAVLADALDDALPTDYAALRAVRVSLDNTDIELAEAGSRPDVVNSYSVTYDSWLVARLSPGGAADDLVREHERLLRAGALATRLARDPDPLRDRGLLADLLGARLVLPRPWRAGQHRRDELVARHRGVLAARGTPGPATSTVEIARLREEYRTIAARIATVEGAQDKILATYRQVKRATPPVATDASIAERVRDAAARVSNEVLGAPIADRRTGVSRGLALDDAFYERLNHALSAEERGVLDTAVGPPAGGRPAAVSDLIGLLDVSADVVAGNDACSRIRVWEDAARDALPGARPAAEPGERLGMRALGWGDLIVARERLVGYDAREIAHIENVLPGEEKVREHERTRTTEEITETESLTERESERDLQTSERYELQSQAQSTIDQDFAITAGVNTSGRYGLTKVETFLDAGFQRSKSESRASATSLAKEVVARSVERTFESVRRLRSLSVTEQLRELNVHTLDNSDTDGAEGPQARSGMYLWVEKLLEVELRHYGTRLMLEFHVPEPALSLLEAGDDDGPEIRKPAPLRIGPSDIKATNYLCLAREYGADDITPPPPAFIQVGWAWASTPNESDNENTSEDTVGELVEIPDDYVPVSGRALVSAHPAKENYVEVLVAVGGHDVVNLVGSAFGESDFDFEVLSTWPKGVPVSVRAHGHFDKTLTAQITITCKRNAEAFTTWQIQTWESIRQAHTLLMAEYQRAVERRELAASRQPQFPGRPDADSRRIERDELRKWAIKALRYPNHFEFDAVERVGDFQEVAPLDADLQAPIVRFFEEAFEWREMSYFLYPYYWGRRASWPMRQKLTYADPRHEAFLRAGAARLVVPVTPGFEERVLNYLESEGDEYERITGPEPDATPPGSDVEDLWLELLRDRADDVARGSGTLTVEQGQRRVTVNDDSVWTLTVRDVGRELYIAGMRYAVAEIVGERAFDLDVPFAGASSETAIYATGSVPFSPPWLVRLPTSLVVLAEQKAKLTSLV